MIADDPKQWTYAPPVPDAPTPPSARLPPGYEHWVRATSNGDLDMEIDRLKRAGVI